MCAYKAELIEKENEGYWASPHIEEHINYAMTSIINSVVFLEAMINELFDELKKQEKNKSKISNIVKWLADKSVVALIAILLAQANLT